MPLEDVDVVICSSSGFAHGIPTAAPEGRLLPQPPAVAVPAGGLRADPARARAPRPALRAAASARLGPARRQAGDPLPRQLQRGAAAGADGVRHPRRRPSAAGVHRGSRRAVGARRRQRPASSSSSAARAATRTSRSCAEPSRTCRTSGSWSWAECRQDGRGPRNITAAVDVPDDELRWYYANCRAVIAVAHEDFGLTPLEGNAFGRPALVLRAGGFLDTLVEGVTGHYIEALTPRRGGRHGPDVAGDQGSTAGRSWSTPTGTAPRPSPLSCSARSRRRCSSPAWSGGRRRRSSTCVEPEVAGATGHADRRNQGDEAGRLTLTCQPERCRTRTLTVRCSVNAQRR